MGADVAGVQKLRAEQASLGTELGKSNFQVKQLQTSVDKLKESVHQEKNNVLRVQNQLTSAHKSIGKAEAAEKDALQRSQALMSQLDRAQGSMHTLNQLNETLRRKFEPGQPPLGGVATQQVLELTKQCQLEHDLRVAAETEVKLLSDQLRAARQKARDCNLISSEQTFARQIAEKEAAKLQTIEIAREAALGTFRQAAYQTGLFKRPLPVGDDVKADPLLGMTRRNPVVLADDSPTDVFLDASTRSNSSSSVSGPGMTPTVGTTVTYSNSHFDTIFSD